MTDIDTLLRRDAGRDFPEGGFTERVMAALPARAPARRDWLRPALVMGSALLGSALAVVLSPAVESPVGALGQWLASGSVSTGAMATLAIGGALLLSAVVLAFDAD